MTELEKAHERIQVICEKIRIETLEPAKLQAQEIIEEAKKEAQNIKDAAIRDSEKIHAEVKMRLEEEKRIFTSSLEQSAKQSIELLKQKIEQSLFNPALEKWVTDELSGAKEHAKLIEVLIQAISKEGIQTDLTVQIPQAFTVDEITAHIDKNILEKLKKCEIVVSDIKGGVKVTLKGKHMTLDLSDSSLKELISSFVRKDFRKMFFVS